MQHVRGLRGRERLGGIGSVALTIILAGCGGSSGPAQPSVSQVRTSSTPFVAFVDLNAVDVVHLSGLHYRIEPRQGSVSRPVDVQYAVDYLARRGYVSQNAGTVTIPVFGLYAGYDNKVDIEEQLDNGTVWPISATVSTADYVDPSGVYDHPTLLKARAAGSTLDFDYFVMKSATGSPVRARCRSSSLESGSARYSRWS